MIFQQKDDDPTNNGQFLETDKKRICRERNTRNKTSLRSASRPIRRTNKTWINLWVWLKIDESRGHET